MHKTILTAIFQVNQILKYRTLSKSTGKQVDTKQKLLVRVCHCNNHSSHVVFTALYVNITSCCVLQNTDIMCSPPSLFHGYTTIVSKSSQSVSWLQTIVSKSSQSVLWLQTIVSKSSQSVSWLHNHCVEVLPVCFMAIQPLCQSLLSLFHGYTPLCQSPPTGVWPSFTFYRTDG